MEPISPELVLVDPELALAPEELLPSRAGRQRLDVDSAVGSVPAQTLLWQVPAEVWSGRWAWRNVLYRTGWRAAPLLLALSLFVTGLLSAVALSGRLDEQPGPFPSGQKQAAPAPVVTPARAGSNGSPVGETVLPRSSVPVVTAGRGTSDRLGATARRSSKRSTAAASESTPRQQTRRVPPSTVLGETRAMAERKVLALVVQSPAGKLPPALIDRQTGLAKNNLQAICRVTRASSFVCVVRPLQHGPKEGLHLRYRPTQDGRGAFTWDRYRDS